MVLAAVKLGENRELGEHGFCKQIDQEIDRILAQPRGIVYKRTLPKCGRKYRYREINFTLSRSITVWFICAQAIATAIRLESEK